MAIKHATTKAPGQKVYAVADWNADHAIDNATITAAMTDFAAGLVPYTGATADLNLGAFDFLTTGEINSTPDIAGSFPVTIRAVQGNITADYDPLQDSIAGNFTYADDYGNSMFAKAGYYYFDGATETIWALWVGGSAGWGNAKFDNTIETGQIIDLGLSASKVVFSNAQKQLTSTGIGTSSQFIKGDGSLDGSTYLTAEVDTLQFVTNRGEVTNNIVKFQHSIPGDPTIELGVHIPSHDNAHGILRLWAGAEDLTSSTYTEIAASATQTTNTKIVYTLPTAAANGLLRNTSGQWSWDTTTYAAALHRHSELSASDGTPNPALQVDAAGQVGIGTTTPNNRLQVNAASAIIAENILRLSSSTTGFSDTNDNGIAHSLVFDGCAYSGGSGVVQRDGAKIAMLKENSWNEALVATGVHASMLFYTSSGSIAAPTLTEKMRITSAGDVGIGATAPDAKLEVETISTFGKQAVTIDQNDIDQAFLDYQGESEAGAAKNISSWTNATIAGYVKVEINGAAYWMPFYNAPTS